MIWSKIRCHIRASFFEPAFCIDKNSDILEEVWRYVLSDNGGRIQLGDERFRNAILISEWNVDEIRGIRMLFALIIVNVYLSRKVLSLCKLYLFPVALHIR